MKEEGEKDNTVMPVDEQVDVPDPERKDPEVW